MANIVNTKALLRANKTVIQKGNGRKKVTITVNRRTRVRIRRS